MMLFIPIFVVYEGFFQMYYRVTTRVDGPRNNVTITQTALLL